MNRGVNPVNDPTSKYYVPVEQRRVLAEHEVTLNGLRASIGGVRNDFATITQLPNGVSADFAWKTVEHVIEHSEGKFNA